MSDVDLQRELARRMSTRVITITFERDHCDVSNEIYVSEHEVIEKGARQAVIDAMDRTFYPNWGITKGP